jgi:nucleoside-diphosphate-sugar epimerase
MKNILVTGSKGFIGKSLSQRLKELGYSVIEFTGDVKDKGSYEKLNAEKIDHCIHLAARSFVPDSWSEPDDFIQNNVYGTERVLEFCRNRSVSLTFMSSYLYGTPEKLPINEEHPLSIPNPYALSKHLAEQLCEFYTNHYGLKITILRPFNTYGPGQKDHFLIPFILGQFFSDAKEISVKDLDPKRDYVYLTDVVEAIVKTINVKEKFLILNIGSGESYSVKEVIDAISAITGTKKSINSANEKRPNEIPDTIADISKAKKFIDWNPKVGFEEGLRKIIEENYPGKLTGIQLK